MCNRNERNWKDNWNYNTTRLHIQTSFSSFVNDCQNNRSTYVPYAILLPPVMFRSERMDSTSSRLNNGFNERLNDGCTIVTATFSPCVHERSASTQEANITLLAIAMFSNTHTHLTCLNIFLLVSVFASKSMLVYLYCALIYNRPAQF